MQRVFLTPHTHYDAAWAFTREGYLEINEGILEQAAHLMETADFKFCLEQAFLLNEINKKNPPLFRRLKKLAKAGKLEMVDGQWLMADMMLPSGEVLIREILLGKRYLQENFGIAEVPVAWAADSFGMNAQLPQIYKKAGYKWLAFRRGARADIRESEFLWKGLDGTTIISHWFPSGYRAGLDVDRWETSYITLNKFAATNCILMPCGSGSMPPQPEVVSAVKKWNEDHPAIEMKMATPRQFFQALEASGKMLETIEGELYDDELVNVFPQVCSSRIWIIQNSRECEVLIINAEEYATIAWILGAAYPAAELKEAWEQMAYIAFHDIITGSGVDEVYEEVKDIFATLRARLNRILHDALTYITGKVDTKERGIAVFNPLPWRLRNNCRTFLSLPEGEAAPATGGDQDVGLVVENFVADVPPLGYRLYGRPPRGEQPLNNVTVEGNVIKSAFFTLKVAENNGIIEVFDSAGQRLLRGNEIIIEDEVGDLYYHRGRFSPELIKGESMQADEGFAYGSFKPKGFRIEEDSLRVRVIFENEYYCLTWPYRLKERFPPVLYKYKTLDIVKEVIVYRDIPRIDFITRVDNKYPNIRLRVRFDTGIDRKLYFRETQFGVVAEPTELLTKVAEVWKSEPSRIPNFLSWFDISDGVRGVTFMNKGLPAVEIAHNLVYITLLRSVGGLSADGTAGPLVPTPEALELRPYTFEYAVELHDGDWRKAEMYKKAEEFHHLPITVPAEGSGDLPPQLSFFEISPNNLLLSALKKAEDSDEVILRFFETRGESTVGRIEVFKELKRVSRVDLLEREEREIPFTRRGFVLPVQPFEIVTLKLKF